MDRISNFNVLFFLQETSGIADHSLTLLHQALPTVVRDVDLATSSGCSQARKAMIQLHSLDKKIEYTDNLMVNYGRQLFHTKIFFCIFVYFLHFLFGFPPFLPVQIFCSFF